MSQYIGAKTECRHLQGGLEKNVNFPGSWLVFPQFVIKRHLSLQLPKLPPNINRLLQNPPFCPTMTGTVSPIFQKFWDRKSDFLLQNDNFSP